MTKMVRIQISNAHKKSWMERCNWSCKLEDIIENLDTDDEEQILLALRSSTGRLRKIISNKLRIRKIPKLIFLIDSQINDALKIDALIDDINNGKFETYR